MLQRHEHHAADPLPGVLRRRGLVDRSMYLIELFLLPFCASFCAVFAVLNWMAWRRYQRLNALLQDICWQAWRMRHMPVWIAWSDMTGIGFRLVPTSTRRAAEE